MKAILNSILLVDDLKEDNFYHSIIIQEANLNKDVATVRNGLEALEYLVSEKHTTPNLIFLDYSMPKMNGKEFIEAYDDLDLKNKSEIKIILLSTSLSPYDVKSIENLESITEYRKKPLTTEMLGEILSDYFE